ncbi:MAG: T9SS type A sorting domain-containing protein [Candidatus Krumholzibacteria bacterium]|nr:T9SS type A sorting domain-containing protein [Candidatus Krumholzibacteria bacterium]
MPQHSHAQLTIYDPSGRRVATLVDEVRDAGPNEVMWNGTNDSGNPLATGVYFYRLNVRNEVITKKPLLLK